MSRAHGWNIPVVGCLAAGALLLGCGGQTKEATSATELMQDHQYRENYSRSAEWVREGLDSGRCKKESTCGELAFINCQIEVDGPGYYIHVPTGTVLEICGGACMLGPQVNGWCMACPPPEWSCGY
ncbi:hypothetical protein [Hyalangium gracile]|uniref:hypothetical protein n=1 Tax=Hyalangium gracile TaxID=394092 RepID=UPI001CCE2E1F|nr:hypothetical protein [Hyalangium gracile]